MPERLPPLVLCAAAALSGCSSLGEFFALDSNDSAAAATADDSSPADDDIDEMLLMLAQLTNGDETIQASYFDSASRALARAPNPTNRLRYALAMSVPGHRGSDLEAAAASLRELLDSRELLPRQRRLATIQLESVDRFLDLRAEASAAATARDTAQSTRMAADIELNELRSTVERLEAQLQDATLRLDAITNIEQSISERDDDEN